MDTAFGSDGRSNRPPNQRENAAESAGGRRSPAEAVSAVDDVIRSRNAGRIHGTVVATETVYTPITLPSCDRVCSDVQWLLYRTCLHTIELLPFGYPLRSRDRYPSCNILDIAFCLPSEIHDI